MKKIGVATKCQLKKGLTLFILLSVYMKTVNSVIHEKTIFLCFPPLVDGRRSHGSLYKESFSGNLWNQEV